MTETCNGYFDPLEGDKKSQKRVPNDDYHPRYPDINETGKVENAKPVSETESTPQPK